MYRVIKASQHKDYYLVKIGFDNGGPEDGPILECDEVICKAVNARAAEYRFENKFRYDRNFEGCSASLATREDMEKFIADMKQFNEEYQYMLDAGMIQTCEDVQEQINADEYLRNLSLGQLRNEYQYFEDYYDNHGGFKQFVSDARNCTVKHY